MKRVTKILLMSAMLFYYPLLSASDSLLDSIANPSFVDVSGRYEEGRRLAEERRERERASLAAQQRRKREQASLAAQERDRASLAAQERNFEVKKQRLELVEAQIRIEKMCLESPELTSCKTDLDPE